MISSLIVKDQGFDCVIKAFRLGRGARLSHWNEGDYIFWDPTEREIKRYSQNADCVVYWDVESTACFMSHDWEVYTI